MPYSLWSHLYMFSETKIVLSNKVILYSILCCFVFIYYISVTLIVIYFLFSEIPLSQLLDLSDPFFSPHVLTHVCHLWIQNFYFCLEDQHHLAITSLIRLVRMTIRQCFFPQNTLLFHFFGEDGWVIARENKTECCSIGNCQNTNLLPTTMSSPPVLSVGSFLFCSPVDIRSNMHYIFLLHKHLYPVSEMRLYIRNYFPEFLSIWSFSLILLHLKKNK